MGRHKNELSAIQANAEVFAGIKADIDRFTVRYLASIGPVSHTTIYKYRNGEAINPKREDQLLRTIKKAKEIKSEADRKKVLAAQELVES